MARWCAAGAKSMVARRIRACTGGSRTSMDNYVDRDRQVDVDSSDR